MEEAKKPEHTQKEFLPEIKRGRFGELRIYEVSESELDTIASGSPNSICLIFAISLLSMATSFLIALLTAEIGSDRVFTVFVVITTIGFIAGGVLFCIWFKTRTSVSRVVRSIKSRMPPEGIPEDRE